MEIQPTSDHGQKLPPPAGKVIGFVDTKANFEAFTQSLQRVGFPASRITSIHGEDGLHLLDRLKHKNFFFSDSEDSIIQASIDELKKGHYAVAVDIDNRDDAARIADIAKQDSGHGFSYFGTWVTEQLS
jgi:hypothetical protein